MVDRFLRMCLKSNGNLFFFIIFFTNFSNTQIGTYLTNLNVKLRIQILIQFTIMLIIRSLQLFYIFSRGKLLVLNLFESRSTNPAIIYREIVATRLFLMFFSISVCILMAYTSLSLRMRSKTIQTPSHSIYEQLQGQYPDTLQCPCTQIAIPYGKFIRVQPLFHQICSSDFVSQDWIDFTFAANLTVIWPMDVRTSLSAMWQLIAALCQSSKTILIDAFDRFSNLPLISSTILHEELLQLKVQSELQLIRETASSNLMQPLTTVQLITEMNGFMSGLSISYVPWSVISLSLFLPIQSTKYIQQGSTEGCYCDMLGSCPLPGNIYLYNMWETDAIYDTNIIVANETLPGIIVDCSPLRMALASSLECFYSQECVDILLSTYPKTTNITILNTSLSNRFSPTANNEQLIKEGFLERILNETLYESYYNACSPIHCMYTYTLRFDWIYILTTLIALLGGLNITCRLISPYLVDFIFFLKNIRQRSGPRVTQQNQSTIFQKNRTKHTLIQFHLFFNHSR
jgi:hypothetical protein